MLHTVRCTSCPRSAHRSRRIAGFVLLPQCVVGRPTIVVVKICQLLVRETDVEKRNRTRCSAATCRSNRPSPDESCSPQLSSISTGYHPNARCDERHQDRRRRLDVRAAATDAVRRNPRPARAARTGCLLPGIGRIAAAFAFRVVHARQSGRGHAVAPAPAHPHAARSARRSAGPPSRSSPQRPHPSRRCIRAGSRSTSREPLRSGHKIVAGLDARIAAGTSPAPHRRSPRRSRVRCPMKAGIAPQASASTFRLLQASAV